MLFFKSYLFISIFFNVLTDLKYKIKLISSKNGKKDNSLKQYNSFYIFYKLIIKNNLLLLFFI